MPQARPLILFHQDIQQRPELVMKNDPSGEQHIDSTRRIVDLLVEMVRDLVRS